MSKRAKCPKSPTSRQTPGLRRASSRQSKSCAPASLLSACARRAREKEQNARCALACSRSQARSHRCCRHSGTDPSPAVFAWTRTVLIAAVQVLLQRCCAACRACACCCDAFCLLSKRPSSGFGGWACASDALPASHASALLPSRNVWPCAFAALTAREHRGLRWIAISVRSFVLFRVLLTLVRIAD